MFSEAYAPTAIIDENGRDQLAACTDRGSGPLYVATNGSLEATFDLPDTVTIGSICYRAGGKYESGILELPGGGGRGGSDGNTAGSAATRVELAPGVFDVSPWITGEDDRLDVKLSWEGRREIGDIFFVQPTPVRYERTACQLLEARKSEGSLVTTKVGSRDGERLNLTPGEYVDVTFAPPPGKPGTDRRFVLATTGHYSKGPEEAVAIEEVSDALPTASARGIHPNPFAKSTSIAYQMPETGGDMDLTIHAVTGQVVREIRRSHDRGGSFSVEWDGTDSRGLKVAAGIYFCRIETPQKTEMKKISVVR